MPRKKKPPKAPEEIEITVKAVLMMDSLAKQGKLHFKFQDCLAEFFDTEDKKKTWGHTGGCIGGDVELQRDMKDRWLMYAIKPMDLFEAFREALGKTDDGTCKEQK